MFTAVHETASGICSVGLLYLFFTCKEISLDSGKSKNTKLAALQFRWHPTF